MRYELSDSEWGTITRPEGPPPVANELDPTNSVQLWVTTTPRGAWIDYRPRLIRQGEDPPVLIQAGPAGSIGLREHFYNRLGPRRPRLARVHARRGH